MAIVYLAFVEGGHGYNTAGKRTPPIKSLGGRVIKEHEFNEPTAQHLIAELKRCGVHVYDAAPGDRDVPLKERVDYANKIYWQYIKKYGKDNVKAIYVSIHFNAIDGKFDGEEKDPSGFSVHVYEGHRNKDAGSLANSILSELKKGTKQISRGVVEQDLYITRETAMVAVLSENGFMDNEREAKLMIDPDFQLEVAREHARGICKYFNIPYVFPVIAPPARGEVAKPGVVKAAAVVGLHRVIVNGKQVGAFKEQDGIITTVTNAIAAKAAKIEIERV